jgi:hypothetical protein
MVGVGLYASENWVYSTTMSKSVFEFFEHFNKYGFGCISFQEGSPLPKLEVENTIPTLSDICNDQNEIEAIFLNKKGFTYMFIVLMIDCRTLGNEISGVTPAVPYQTPAFYAEHEQEFLPFVHERLKYVFYKAKNSQWVERMAHNVIEHMKNEQTRWFVVDEFIDKYMTPFIQRNYCTTDTSEDPKDRKYVTVGAMYGNMHTFLCGTKRKRSPVSKLNSDIIAKIFDHMQISAYPNVKWNSFGTNSVRPKQRHS